MRRLLHGVGSLIQQRLGGTRLGGARLRPGLLEPLGQRLHLALELTGPVGQFLGARGRPVAGLPFPLTLSLTPLHPVSRPLLRLRQLLRLIAQRLHGPFKGRALQHLGTLFQLLAHLLLLLAQLLHRFLRVRTTESVSVLVELLKLLLHLRGHRVAQHFLNVLHARGQRRVERIGIFQPRLELLGVLTQRINFGTELLLVARELLRFFRRGKAHGLALAALALGGAIGLRLLRLTPTLEVTIARRVVSVLLQSSFLLRQPLRLCRQ